MRIALVVVSRLKGQGGKEAAISMVGRGLVARGHDVSVALAGPSVERAWESDLPGLAVGRLPEQWSAVRWYPTATVHFLGQFVRARRPDVVVVTEPGGVGLLRLACHLARVPRPAVVSWVHGDVRRMSYYRWLRWCDGHLAINSGIAGQVAEQIGSMDHVHVVWNPIKEPDRLVPRPQSGSPAVFVFIGRIEWQKRLDRLLDALSGVTRGRWRLDVIGDGALRGDMERLAVQLGFASRIAWYGWLADPWRVVTEASACLMTSETEGFPLVLLEAAARGIPLVAMDCKFGPSEIVQNGRNGWLVPMGDAAAFREVLNALCSGCGEVPEPETVRATVASFGLGPVLDRFERGLEDAIASRRGRLGGVL